MPALKTLRFRRLVPVVLLASLLALPGCILGVMFADTDLIPVNVDAQYTDLNGERIAVVVQTTPDIYYRYPSAQLSVASALASRMRENLDDGTSVRDVQSVMDYQREHPEWSALTPPELMQALGVTRVVLVDLYEYQTHEPGVQELKLGQMAATLSVMESDSATPNDYAFSTTITAQWPETTQVGTIARSQREVEQQTLGLFARDAAGLFYDHKVTGNRFRTER